MDEPGDTRAINPGRKVSSTIAPLLLDAEKEAEPEQANKSYDFLKGTNLK